MASLKNKNVFLALLLIAFASCTTNQENNPQTQAIEIIDTLNFAFPEYSLQIVDYNESSHHYLGIAAKLGIIAEYDSTGNQTALKYISKDGLKIGVRSILSAGYLPNGDKLIETFRGYFILDKEWTILDSLFSQTDIRHKKYVTQGRTPNITEGGTIWENLTGNVGGMNFTKDYFDTTLTLRSLNLNTKTIESHLPYPKNASFKDTLNRGTMPYVASGFNPNELLVAFPIDPVLYVYNYKEKAIKKEVRLDLKNFDNSNSGIRFDQQQEHFHEGFQLNAVFINKFNLSGRILNLRRTPNYLFVIHKEKNHTTPDTKVIGNSIRLALLEDKKFVAIYDKSFNKIADLEVPTAHTGGYEFIPINDSTFVTPYGDFRRTYTLPPFLKMRIKGLTKPTPPRL